MSGLKITWCMPSLPAMVRKSGSIKTVSVLQALPAMLRSPWPHNPRGACAHSAACLPFDQDDIGFNSYEELRTTNESENIHMLDKGKMPRIFFGLLAGMLVLLGVISISVQSTTSV